MRNVVVGAIAGAAGTMALDIASYGDMALRGRQSSGLPAEVIRRLASRAHIDALARPDDVADATTKNRRSALGALSGYAVGIGIGAVYGLSRPLVRRLPVVLSSLALGAAAMLASDVPAAKLGATDLKTWGTSGWLSDAIPHAMFGLATVLVADAIDR